MKSDATVKRVGSQDENVPLDNSGNGTANAEATTAAANGAAAGDQDGEVGLKAKMSLLNGCTVIVGSIIGSGIFVSPTGVLMHTGSVNMALIVWIISGLFSMVSKLSAFCFFVVNSFNSCDMNNFQMHTRHTFHVLYWTVNKSGCYFPHCSCHTTSNEWPWRTKFISWTRRTLNACWTLPLYTIYLSCSFDGSKSNSRCLSQRILKKMRLYSQNICAIAYKRLAELFSLYTIMFVSRSQVPLQYI